MDTTCENCIYYCPHVEGANTGECRRHSLNNDGFPVVLDWQWCGDHISVDPAFPKDRFNKRSYRVKLSHGGTK